MDDNIGVHQTDFFMDDIGASIEIHGGARAVSVLNEELLDQLCAGPLADETDLAAAQGLFDLAEHELIACGTGGSDLADQQSIRILRTLEAVTKRLGMPIRLPFRSFSTFQGYWSRMGASGSGGWAARRALIADLFDPARQRLDDLVNGIGLEISEDLIASLREPAAIREHLARLPGLADTDPPLAIGTAKELVESTAKTVLEQLGRKVNDKTKFPPLIAQAQEALGLRPQSFQSGADGEDAIRKILGGAIGTVVGLDELRNRGYGTGHGVKGVRLGLRSRHARLAVAAAFTWCSFILDTLADPEAPWRESNAAEASSQPSWDDL